MKSDIEWKEHHTTHAASDTPPASKYLTSHIVSSRSNVTTYDDRGGVRVQAAIERHITHATIIERKQPVAFQQSVKKKRSRFTRFAVGLNTANSGRHRKKRVIL